MRKLGEALRSGDAVPADCPTYDEVVLWYSDVTVMIQQRIAEIDWAPLLEREPPEISSRVKTIGTLQDKLRRTSTAQLQTIRDIAGVRFEAIMSLSVQDAVVETIASLFATDAQCFISDMRAHDHFGYRAVHIELRFHSIAWRAEIQVRTFLQGQWANMYEAAADVLGREIRYATPDEGSPAYGVVLGMRGLSTDTIAGLEAQADLVTHQILRIDDLRRGGAGTAELQAEERKLDVLQASVQPLTLGLTTQLGQLIAQIRDIRRTGN
jgi:ppGpp synthetase/RelA/SpoT-type nucleotidyltranferase